MDNAQSAVDAKTPRCLSSGVFYSLSKGAPQKFTPTGTYKMKSFLRTRTSKKYVSARCAALFSTA